MMLIFAHVFFSPYKKLKRSIGEQDWQVRRRRASHCNSACRNEGAVKSQYCSDKCIFTQPSEVESAPAGPRSALFEQYWDPTSEALYANSIVCRKDQLWYDHFPLFAFWLAIFRIRLVLPPDENRADSHLDTLLTMGSSKILDILPTVSPCVLSKHQPPFIACRLNSAPGARRAIMP